VLKCFIVGRIKNGIMNEFRKKKEALEQSLAQKQDTSSKLLDERRRKKKKNSALTYDTEDDTGEISNCLYLWHIYVNHYTGQNLYFICSARG
jgi:hypothetical protein